MYKKNKLGKRFEYRDKLENLEGQEILVSGRVSKINEKKWNNYNLVQLVVQDVRDNKGAKLCNHAHVDPRGSYSNREQQSLLVKEGNYLGKRIKFLAKVFRYETTDGTENYGLRLVRVLV